MDTNVVVPVTRTPEQLVPNVCRWMGFREVQSLHHSIEERSGVQRIEDERLDPLLAQEFALDQSLRGLDPHGDILALQCTFDLLDRFR